MSLTKPSSGDPFSTGATKSTTIVGAIVDWVNQQAVNVKEAAYGALGNDSADDTSAIQGAVDAVNAAGGGTVFFPAGTYHHTGLTLYNGVTLRGQGGARAAGPASTLKYTGTGSRALDGRDCTGVVLEDLAITYNSASFAGNLVDLSKVSTTPTNNVIQRCTLGGSSSSADGATLVYLPGCITSTVSNCYLDYCDIGILGRSVSGDQTNVIRVENCFTRGLGAQTIWIRNAGQGWVVRGNAFEPINNAGSLNAGAYDETLQSIGMTWTGNWMGDTASGQTGTWITLANGLGWAIHGNYFGISTAATGIKFTVNAAQAINISGNFFSGSASGLGIDFGSTASHRDLVILANGYSTNTIPFSGTVPGNNLTNGARMLLDNGTGIQRDRGSTANRPSASSAGASSEYYDTSVNRPIWSDGTNWKIGGGFYVFALTDGATVNTNAASGDYFTLSAAAGRTIAAPTNPAAGLVIRYDILNNTAGAITTTWNAAFKMAGAWVDPAAGKRRTITFAYDGTNWIEQGRAAADI